MGQVNRSGGSWLLGFALPGSATPWHALSEAAQQQRATKASSGRPRSSESRPTEGSIAVDRVVTFEQWGEDRASTHPGSVKPNQLKPRPPPPRNQASGMSVKGVLLNRGDFIGVSFYIPKIRQLLQKELRSGGRSLSDALQGRQ